AGRGQGNLCADLRRAQVLLPQHARLRLASVHEKKVRRPRRERLPDVRSDEDCRRLIATLEKPIYRGCFTLIYAYGLRITEAVTLPVSAVDSKQMVLRVIGKRNKERVLPLTESILQMLREVWKTHRSRRWLFPSRRLTTHLPDATALAASQLRHAHAPAGRGHPDHPDLARPFEPALHGDLHPPDRAAAGPASHAAVPDHRRPLRGKEAQPWLILAFTHPRRTSSWRTLSAGSVLNTRPNTATG